MLVCVIASRISDTWPMSTIATISPATSCVTRNGSGASVTARRCWRLCRRSDSMAKRSSVTSANAAPAVSRKSKGEVRNGGSRGDAYGTPENSVCIGPVRRRRGAHHDAGDHDDGAHRGQRHHVGPHRARTVAPIDERPGEQQDGDRKHDHRCRPCCGLPAAACRGEIVRVHRRSQQTVAIRVLDGKRRGSVSRRFALVSKLHRHVGDPGREAERVGILSLKTTHTPADGIHAE